MVTHNTFFLYTRASEVIKCTVTENINCKPHWNLLIKLKLLHVYILDIFYVSIDDSKRSHEASVPRRILGSQKLLE